MYLSQAGIPLICPSREKKKGGGPGTKKRDIVSWRDTREQKHHLPEMGRVPGEGARNVGVLS